MNLNDVDSFACYECLENCYDRYYLTYSWCAGDAKYCFVYGKFFNLLDQKPPTGINHIIINKINKILIYIYRIRYAESKSVVQMRKKINFSKDIAFQSSSHTSRFYFEVILYLKNL